MQGGTAPRLAPCPEPCQPRPMYVRHGFLVPGTWFVSKFDTGTHTGSPTGGARGGAAPHPPHLAPPFPDRVRVITRKKNTACISSVVLSNEEKEVRADSHENVLYVYGGRRYRRWLVSKFDVCIQNLYKKGRWSYVKIPV